MTDPVTTLLPEVMMIHSTATFPTISTTTILLLPLIGGILSIINLIFLAYFRVLNQPKCDPESEEKLKKAIEELKERSEYLKHHPQQLVEKEREVANHILKIYESIKNGASSFLITEYKFMAVFVVIMGVVLGLATEEWSNTFPSFIIGAILSAGCGWLGMRIAVEANVRTATACNADNVADGLNNGLQVAFASGAVMGLGVTGTGMLGLCVIYGAWEGVEQTDTRYLAGFGFGASAIALFARVGGGIYTKAADVGADLIGKVENGIPEDDPRNPATIADNVGDNVGDVAGMGADLFESFVGSIIASVQLAPMFVKELLQEEGREYVLNSQDTRALIAIPFWIAGFGMVFANIGVYFVRTSCSCHSVKANKDGVVDSGDMQHLLLGVMFNALMATSFLAAVGALVTCGIFLGWENMLTYKIWGCMLIGLAAGVVIGQFTEYVTSYSYKPTQTIAKKSKFGEAGVIIQGLSIGMLSCTVPAVVIVITILSCTALASTYGVAIAAVGMLSTLGLSLATDAFGPVADNAGGIAEMAELPAFVRENTDALDALGNTTAATGKGFAIGSAVLTSLALLVAYKSDVGITDGIDVTDPKVLSAAIFGACLPYIFAAITMMSVGRAATMMIGEVRTQFREKNLLGTNPNMPIGTPDYQSCVEISTQASLVEMIIPGTLAICAPLSIGFILGPRALGGMLVGSITSGFMLAVYMANAGGAWDNAKKWIEADGMGKHRGKGTKYHNAAIVGDTIGDPFKDTSGPALNILIKLMTMISLVFGKNVFAGKKAYDAETPYWAGLIIIAGFLLFALAIWKYMRYKKFGKIDDLPEDLETEEGTEYKGAVGVSV